MMNFEEKKSNVKKDYVPICIYLVITFAFSFAFGIIIGITNASESVLNVLQLIPQGIIFIILMIKYFKRLKADFLSLTKNDLIWTLITAIILIIVTYTFPIIFEKLNVTMNNQNTLNEMFIQTKLFTTIDIVLFAPFIEELLARYSIDTLCSNNKIFLIVSSILFGVLHGVGIVTIVYILAGLCLGFIYLKTNRNLASSIIVHILNNVFSVITMFLFL